MKNIIIFLQIFLSLLLIFSILIQAKGTGFGRVWGAPVSFTRRGLERIVFRATFLITLLFILISIISLLV